MTKFLNKLFLCGIFLSDISYNLTYSSDENKFTQLYGVDFENNSPSDKNAILETVKYESDPNCIENHIIGFYDTNKYIEYKDTDNNNKIVKIFCRLGENNVGIREDNNETYNVYPIENNDNYEITAIDDKGIYVKLHISDFTINCFKTKDIDSIKEGINFLDQFDNNFEFLQKVIIIKLGNTYEIKELNDSNNNVVKVIKLKSDKPLAYEDLTTREWYILNQTGGKGEKLNKALLTIEQGANLIMNSKDESGIEITKFGHLKNLGTITLNEGNELKAPEVVLREETTERWNNSILNLDEAAIENDGGEIILYPESKITGGVIKGGEVDLSNLINFDESLKKANMMGINTSFYNTNIWLTKDTKNLNKIQRFTGSSLFVNFRFYSDKGNEIRHSTLMMPASTLQYKNDQEIATKYCTTKPVLYSPLNVDDDFEEKVLNIFCLSKDNLSTDKTKWPLQFSSNSATDLYKFVNNFKSANLDKGTNLDNDFAVDLFSFVFDQPEIDYSKFLGNITNLERIQFVCDKDTTNNKNLKLLPGNFTGNNSKLVVSQEFNKWPGILSFSDSVKPLAFNNKQKEAFTYNVKLNQETDMETDGNINLLLDNYDTLKLSNFEHKGGTLRIYSYNNKPLTLQVPANKYKHSNGSIYFNAPVSLQIGASE